MNSAQKDTTMLILEFVGIDSFDCPTYKDQFGRLWKDTHLGDYDTPDLCSVSPNEPDGEPASPIEQAYTFNPAPYRRDEHEFQYMMLGRLRSDCEYYLGYGNRSPRILSDDPQGHIDRMKELWREFPAHKKPQWLTWNQILEYEKEICKKDQKTEAR
ncbi:hypothetical protein LI221_16340 [Faecalimonas umbilicata]|nr:hypothetical protein [Faecalimonas umbilicata]